MRLPLMVLPVLCAMTAPAAAQDTAHALKNAEATGTALFAAIQAGSLVGPEEIRNFEALQHATDPQRCKGTFISWMLLPDRAQATGIYGISSVPSDGRLLVVGRHFRAHVADGIVDLSTPAASTKGCLVLKVEPGVVGAYATEVIAATPTEFHVLESRLHGIALCVAAGGEAWDVSRGNMQSMGRIRTNPPGN